MSATELLRRGPSKIGPQMYANYPQHDSKRKTEVSGY